MSDITQKLGVDASGVVSGLETANAAIDKHLQKLDQLGKGYGNIGSGSATRNLENAAKAHERVSKAAEKSARSSNQFNKSFSNGAKQSQSSVSRLTSDFARMSRTLGVAISVGSGMSLIRRELTNGVSGAARFQRGLAEIQTIAPNLRGDIGSLAGRVRNLSDEFNAPLDNVTEGLYQTISNQVQGTSNQFNVLSSGLKLSKTSSATAEEGINLVTASINSFGKSGAEADDIASKWFKTVELGRVRIGDLGNSIGRVSKLADQSGVSMEELQAAIATLTISGVTPSESLTQIRGAMNALLKPTDRLKEVLSDLGFESGQQAVELNGFVGTISLLKDAVGGSTTELAKIFPRVRALAGVLGLADGEAEKFNSNLTEIQNAAGEDFDRAFKIVVETDAEQATKTLNQLRNLVTTEFGSAVISAFNGATDAAESFGGVLSGLGSGFDGFAGLFGLDTGLGEISGAQVFAGVAGAAAPATAAIAAYVAQVKLASLASSNFGSAAGRIVGVFGGIATGVLAAIAAVSAFNQAIERSIEDARQNFLKQVAEQQKQTDQAAAAQAKSVQSNFDRVLDANRSGVGEGLQSYNRETSSILGTASDLADNLASGIQKIFDSRQSAIDALVKKSSTALGESRSAFANISDLQIATEDKLFQRGLRNLDNRTAFNKVLERSATLGREAADQLSRASNQDERQDAQGIFDRAFALEQQAFSIAQQSNDLRGMARSEERLRTLTRQRTDALRDYARTQQSVSRRAGTAAQQERSALSALQREFEGLADGPQLQDSLGRALPEEERIRNTQQFFKEFDRFAEQANQASPGVGTLLDLAGLRADFQANITAQEARALGNGLVDFSGLNDQLTQARARFDSLEPVQALVDVILQNGGKEISDPNELISEFNQTAQLQVEVVFQSSEIEKAQREVLSSIGESQALLDARFGDQGLVGNTVQDNFRLLEKLTTPKSFFEFNTGTEAADALSATTNLLREIPKDGKIARVELESARNAVQNLRKAFESGETSGNDFTNELDVETVEKSFDALQRGYENQISLSEELEKSAGLSGKAAAEGFRDAAIEAAKVRDFAETIGADPDEFEAGVRSEREAFEQPFLDADATGLQSSLQSANGSLQTAVSLSATLNSNLAATAESASQIQIGLTEPTEQVAQAEPVQADVDTSGVESLNQAVGSVESRAATATQTLASVGPALASSTGQAQSQVSGLISSAGTLRNVLSSAPSGLSSGLASANGQLAAATGQANAFAAAMQQAASAASGISIGGSGGGTQNAFFGGRLFRNGGGFARHRDTIPASLSPGEFVMNSQSSRRFAAELSAMNAGATPAFRNSGGGVDQSTTVGDIHVSVAGSNSEQGTARNIATQLRREIRRGTSRI